MSQQDQIGASGAPWLSIAPPDAVSGSARGTGVRDAIARAAQATGVDFNYLLAQARVESGLNPQARAATSSAAGLYQFTNATWAQTLSRHADALGGQSGTMAAALADPQSRARLMALRYDPETSAMMAAQLAGDNRQALTTALGREPEPAELYLAHFLGTDGATRFLSALATNPGQSAASLMPKAAESNRAIFFDASGSARSVDQVMTLLRTRMAGAMTGDDSLTGALAALAPGLAPGAFSGVLPSPLAGEDVASAVPASAPSGGPLAQAFQAAREAAASLSGAGSARPSMAETLRSAFSIVNDGSGGGTPDMVRAAYGRLNQLGL